MMGNDNNDTTNDTDKQLSAPDMPTSQSAVDLSQGEHVATTPINLPIQAPASSKKPLIWTLAIAIVLLLIGGGTFYFMTATKSADETPVVSASPSPVTKKAPIAQDVITAVKALTHTGTLAVITKSDATSGQTSQGTYVYQAVAYQTASRKFATDPGAAYGVGTTGNTAAATADFAAFKTYLTGNGFTEVKEKTLVDDPISVASTKYTSTTVVCQLTQDDYSKSIDKTMTFRQSLVGLTCSDISSYEDVAKTIDPIYKALTANPKANPSSPDGYIPYMQNLKITDGVEGYKAASVGLAYVGAPLGAGEELLYQEPGKDWMFFMVTQDSLNCKDMTTVTLKKAYATQDCYNVTTNKTVKVSTLL